MPVKYKGTLKIIFGIYTYKLFCYLSFIVNLEKCFRAPDKNRACNLPMSYSKTIELLSLCTAWITPII